MKKLIFLIAVTFVLFANVNLKADLELGEATPCVPVGATFLEWGMPFYTEFYPEFCPDCKFGIEFYLTTYDGKVMLQIVAIYLVSATPPSTYESCINCQNTNNQVFKDAYKSLVKYFAEEDLAMVEALITPVPCKRFDNFLLSPTYLIIPIDRYIGIDPSIILIPDGPNSYRETVIGRWIICETMCCCIDVGITRGLDQTQYILEINSFLDCSEYTQPECTEEECQGSCNDYRFKWNCFLGYMAYSKKSIFENKDMLTLQQNDDNNFTIICDKNINEDIYLEIIDLQGKTVKTYNLGSNFISKDISIDVISGIYILKIGNENNTYWMQKTVIKK